MVHLRLSTCGDSGIVSPELDATLAAGRCGVPGGLLAGAV